MGRLLSWVVPRLYAPGGPFGAPPIAALVLAAALGCGGDVATISDRDLLAQLGSPNPPLVLDVRTPQEYASGHIAGAVNLPHDEVGARLGELGAERDREVVVYCERGPRALKALDILEASGFREVRHLDGDMSGWRSKALPCVGC
jgi:rhodanese-related sulfurtransferase